MERYEMKRAWGYAVGFWLASAGVAAADPISAAIITGLGFTATATAVAATTSFLINVAIFAATKLFTPKRRQALQDRQASVASLSIGEVPPEVIYGEAVTGGGLIDAFNFGGQYGTDWEVLVITLADHEVEEFVGYYISDDFYPYDANGLQPGFRDCLDMEFVNESRTVPPTRFASVSGGRWTSADVLAGRTRVWVAYKANENVWPQGRPSFKFLIKGRKCIDPRTPEAGRVWTDNPAVCRYDYQRGVYAEDRDTEAGQLLIGRGLSEEETPASLTIAAANICDELVAVDEETEKRYRLSAVISADEPFDSVEENFAACMAGIIVQREGSIYVEPGHAKSPSFAITDADLLSQEAATFSEFVPQPERVNSIIPRYIEPSQLWKDHSAPIRRDLDDIATDGGPLEESLSLAFVTSGTQAGRNGEIARRLARLEKRAAVTLGPRYSYIEDGDWGTYTSAIHTGGEPVLMRVEKFSIDEGWNISLAMREISEDCYGDAEVIPDGSVADNPYTGLIVGSVVRILSQTVVYPVSSDPTSISVEAFSATLDAFPWEFDFPDDTFTGLPNDTGYVLFWDIADEEYVLLEQADAVDVRASMTDPGRIFIYSQRTALSGGGYTPPPTDPGGGSGGVYPL